MTCKIQFRKVQVSWIFVKISGQRTCVYRLSRSSDKHFGANGSLCDCRNSETVCLVRKSHEVYQYLMNGSFCWQNYFPPHEHIETVTWPSCDVQHPMGLPTDLVAHVPFCSIGCLKSPEIDRSCFRRWEWYSHIQHSKVISSPLKDVHFVF